MGERFINIEIIDDYISLNLFNIEKYVCFTGRIPDEDVFKILSSIDIGVASDPPNHLNNLSTMNKIMDYMWFGKPIVSYNLVETKFSAGSAALYVNPCTPEALGDGIIQLINDPDQRKNMSNIGKVLVQQLTWQKSEKNLLDLYNSL